MFNVEGHPQKLVRQISKPTSDHYGDVKENESLPSDQSEV